MVASTEHGEQLANHREQHSESIAALEREIETERPHLATRADIAELKTWFMWRLLIGAAVSQGVIAALIKYLPE